MSDKNKPWKAARYTVSHDGAEPFNVSVKGRERWTLECLIAAGAKGCTPIDNPAPRWSAYVFDLRKVGIQIETVTEQHGGQFKGNHARYVLRSKVSRVATETSAA